MSVTERHAPDVPLVNITGEKVAIGPLARDLIPLLTRWSNDFAARMNIGLPVPRAVEQRTAQFERDALGEEGIDFVVYAWPAWRPIGTVSLFNIDHRNGCADFGILIGESEDRGKGYGTEATRLTLDYAFMTLGLLNLGLTVAEWNIAGRRAYARAGFKEFGRRRSCRRLAGRWWDDVHMDAVESEFTGPTLAEG